MKKSDIMWKDTIKKQSDKKISNAFRPLQEAILHLEILGYDEMQNAIDEHFPMKSLNVDAREVMEILKTYVSALINLHVSSKPKTKSPIEDRDTMFSDD